MCTISAEKLFALEDRYMKQGGLYAMWSSLFIINMICMVSDSSVGAHRDFNLVSSLLSTIYCGVSGAVTIYGNKLPSSMLIIAGPVHQYSTWLLLGYYRGGVYGSSPVQMMNAVYTVVVAIFTLDMLVKTWIVSLYPSYYLEYAKKNGGVRAEV